MTQSTDEASPAVPSGTENHPSDVLDMLIVGGGPGGTAAAFRARELGLSALVVDYDDLMKRIRDYSKDKLILPTFGGGDKMKFPKGGDLVSSLHFSPIDKDEMCEQWKALYQKHRIPCRVGVELTGLDERGDGVYRAAAFDHGTRSEVEFLTRSLVLAIGRGVPRRFDIPGNADGIAYRMTDSEPYVGAPACVVGGGTSAAEAVIAISNAKAKAQDPTAVAWSYRGDKLPRVSKALAEVFFGAYVGNGNIHYYPKSEPAAIVTGEDRREYLALRIDRRMIAGRPNETTHLEFLKENCIACIGEDIPEALLASLGVHMATGGPNHKKRMVVNRYLESQRPNVYLIGDLLSQAYFETEDFGADPAGFREIKHRGNVKSALRDGVLVAEVIQQRLQGKEEIHVKIEDAEDPSIDDSLSFAVARPVERGGPPDESQEPSRDVEEAEAFLVRVLPGGIEEAEYPVHKNAVTTIGRVGSDIAFESDTLLSDRHASISHNEDGYSLRDDGSATGVFLLVPTARKQEVQAGDLIRVGRQFLLFAAANGHFSFIHYNAEGREVGRHELTGKAMVVGRQAPDITLDAGDMTLSRRQLALSVEGGRVLVKDLKSANGSYLRVRNARPIEHGQQIRIGQQSLVFSVREDAVLDTGHFEATPKPRVSLDVPPPPPMPQGQPQPESLPPEASVTFRGLGKTLPIQPGQTLCELAEENGLEITAECHSGICGSDPIRILSGAEYLESPQDEECETLEEICELKPGECRLACMVKVKGPVEVEILKS